jgi:alcohol dehydrogenase
LLNSSFERVLSHPEDLDARGAMLVGAHFAGAAIENSMLGATHACANPLTAHYDVPHGVAIALLLSHVVDFNSPVAQEMYQDLYQGDLAGRLRDLAEAAGLPMSLSEAKVPEEALPRLAEEASVQWTGKFNPRVFDSTAALEIYRCAY